MSDQERSKHIYKSIFNLAVVHKSQSKKDSEGKNINFSQTSRRLGFAKTSGSDPARKIYNLITNKESTYSKPENLTTEKIVKFISSIRKSLFEEYSDTKEQEKNTSVKIPKLIRKEDIVKVISSLVALSSEERQSLDLSESETNIILQQILLNIIRYHSPNQQARILQLYKTSIGVSQLSESYSELITDDSVIKSHYLEKRNKYIKNITKEYLNFLGLENWLKQDEKVEYLSEFIQRHISRLESQAGIGEVTCINNKSNQELQKNYLSKDFITKIVHFSIENTIIRESIPIYIQYFQINQLKPLPLYYPYPDNTDSEGLLNPQIKQLNKATDNTGLASQYAYEVIVSFNLKINDKKLLKKIEERLTPEIKPRLIKKGKGGLVFTVRSSGVGGQMSQLIKVINRALLWDVKCIKEKYFPVAHDLVINQELINNNVASPVWSHSLVQLCSLEYLKQALQTESQEESSDKYSFIDEVGIGDYCGFNFMETVIKSALQARLSALLKNNIDSAQYINDLSQTVEQREILRKAKSYLDFYPFSLSAMESYLLSHLLNKEKTDDDLSYLEYDAYLSIITGYLREGLYRKAGKYLNKIKDLNAFESNNSLNIKDDKNLVRSGTILAKYELCKAKYFYFYDWEQEPFDWKKWDKNPEQKPEYILENLHNNDKSSLIHKAWGSLQKAENHLERRLQKYAVINETSQSIFHPHFIILARINFLRAKIFLFFPSFTINLPPDTNLSRKYNVYYAPIYYLELARIYAAKNGNTLDYACYTAYQAFAYIKAGYLVDEKDELINNENKFNQVDLTKNNCFDWAKKLRNESIVHYADFGRKCYYTIKEKSGIDTNQERYGDQCIESLPLIREEKGKEKQGYNPEEKILYIDMSLLSMKKLDDSSEDLEEHIYLFGAKAAIILFARAMCELGSDDNTKSLQEWEKKLKKASRLFTYAWAVAEDGCKTSDDKNNDCDNTCSGETIQKIKNTIIRSHFQDDINNEEYPELEARSIRDIYPHRQSEIADFGKVFAIAAKLVLCFITEEEDIQKKLISEINNLKDNFQDMDRMSNELIENQPGINGHLRKYLENIKQQIEPQIIEISEHKKDYSKIKNIKEKRDEIVTNFLMKIKA